MLALYGTAAAVLALDQLTKHLVVANLAGRTPVDLVGSAVQLRYTTNSGGAFSLLTGAPRYHPSCRRPSDHRPLVGRPGDPDGLPAVTG